mmetsp:Transcript_18246/g.55295  ORF Transcript_18246/g.55295 Transcript_18246/m.55295 type:complete len:86 (+) Transcript_18246:108-365(+)
MKHGRLCYAPGAGECSRASDIDAATPMDVLSDGTWTVRHEDGSTASITLAGGGWTGHDGWQYQLAGQGSTVSFRWSDGTLQTLAE